MPFHVRLLAILLLLSAPASGDEGSRAEGPHVRVVCDFRNDAVAREALRTAEASWELSQRLWGREARPAAPLEVRLFATGRAFDAALDRLGAGEFKRNRAFTSGAAQASLLVVDPECPPETLAALGLPYQTRRLIAHETAHLFAFHAFPGGSSHPFWLAEGSAVWIEEETLKEGRWIADPMDDPFSSTGWVRCKRLLEKGALPSSEAILQDRTEHLGFYDRYAACAGLFRVLKSGAGARVLAEARDLPSGPGLARRLQESVRKACGAEGLAGMDRALHRLVRDSRPSWEEVFRSLETEGEEWTQAAFRDTNAIAWRTGPVGRKEYALEGSLRILPAGPRQMNLLLARDEDGFLSVAFQAGGGVTLLEYASREDRWRTLAFREAALPTGAAFRFEVRAQKGALRVSVDGREVLKAGTGAHPLDAPWGLGAQAGSAGEWSGIRIVD